ncbi:MAG TPA: CPBP family intramembrane glutamic endopeptidase [Verrucomicrobiae bacterium]|nr:CPBP family intramembrane glutamic endopeptidase [Verrucomicrobiae bacterium]
MANDHTNQIRPRPIRALFIFLIVVFIGGALLAPWLYWFVQSVAPDSHLAHNPFHRFVNRSLLVLALLSIWPLLRSLGARSWRDVGLVNPRGECSRLGAGFALGFGSLAFVAVIVLVAHGRQFNSDLTAAKLTGKIAGAAATAIVVAVLEELLFRGAIFGALRKVCDWRIALLISSMIYAIVHFMQSADAAGPITWTTGLELVPQMLRGFGNLQVVIPGFFNLTLAGTLLGLAYQRTGNLYFSIGLHAGWIFWLKSYGFLTGALPSANQWLWGTEKLIDGWLALFVLSFALLVLLRLPQAKPAPRR